MHITKINDYTWEMKSSTLSPPVSKQLKVYAIFNFLGADNESKVIFLYNTVSDYVGRPAILGYFLSILCYGLAYRELQELALDTT